MELVIVANQTIQTRKVFPLKTLYYGNEARNKEGLKGRLIIVEGIDGSGKSTQIHLLEQWLRSRNIAVFLTEWNDMRERFFHFLERVISSWPIDMSIQHLLGI